jgi:hypothetical protein
MTVGQYERQFQNLYVFASPLIPSEQHMIERFRDGLRQELRKGLVTLQPGTVRELVEAAQALETVIGEEDPVIGRQELGKRKEPTSFTGKPPLPKRGGGGFRQGQSSRK